MRLDLDAATLLSPQMKPEKPGMPQTIFLLLKTSLSQPDKFLEHLRILNAVSFHSNPEIIDSDNLTEMVMGVGILLVTAGSVMDFG